MNSSNYFSSDHFLFHYNLSSSELNVTIISNYTSAPGEDPGELGPNEFTAGNVLSLTCMAQGASEEELTYSWSVAGNPDTPGCTSDCFIGTPTTPTLEVGPPIQSFRAGTYTCTVSEADRPSSGSSDEFPVVVVGE